MSVVSKRSSRKIPFGALVRTPCKAGLRARTERAGRAETAANSLRPSSAASGSAGPHPEGRRLDPARDIHGHHGESFGRTAMRRIQPALESGGSGTGMPTRHRTSAVRKDRHREWIGRRPYTDVATIRVIAQRWNCWAAASHEGPGAKIYISAGKSTTINIYAINSAEIAHIGSTCSPLRADKRRISVQIHAQLLDVRLCCDAWLSRSFKKDLCLRQHFGLPIPMEYLRGLLI